MSSTLSTTRKKKGSIHGVIGPPKQFAANNGAQLGATAPEPLVVRPVVGVATSQAPLTTFHQEDLVLPSFTAQPSKSSVDEQYLERFGVDIQRALSAPPAMELASNNIFSYQSKYSHLFGWDIRTEEDYESFYNMYNSQEKPLPPPLEPAFVGTPSWETTPHFTNFGYAQEFQSLSLNDYQKHEINMQHLERAALELTEPDSPGWNPSPQRSFTPNVQEPHSLQLSNNTQSSQNPNSTGNNKRNLSYSSVAAASQPPARMVTPPASVPVVTSSSPASIDSDDQYEESQQQQQPQEPSQSVKSPSPIQGNKQKENGKQTPTSSTSSTPSKYNHISDVTGKIYQLSKDQHGCRFLQKKLEDGNYEDLDAIYTEVYPHIVELMTDPFGNYLCQKLVEHCNEKQKTAIIGAVSTALVKISMNMHGTRAVQKLIECLTAPVQVAKVIEALRNHVVGLIKDLNGNHVIQRCLQKMSYQDKHFIYEAVAPRCMDVATHKHGCCVLQRCIDYANEDQKMILVREVIANALELVQNAFGNYVVQYILDLGNDDVNSLIIGEFLGNIIILSQNKFSSNVIEKCLRISNQKMRSALLIDIGTPEIISTLLQDNFGNYVLQTALGVADPAQYQQLCEVIRPLLHLVKNTPYGKKIESKLNKKPSANNGIFRGGNQTRNNHFISPKRK